MGILGNHKRTRANLRNITFSSILCALQEEGITLSVCETDQCP
uniref:Uncharacterized protein n=1 Tax=Anguilla anguilla TaxID=7936 RepID=A0A0E9PPF8_ANGAN